MTQDPKRFNAPCTGNAVPPRHPAPAPPAHNSDHRLHCKQHRQGPEELNGLTAGARMGWPNFPMLRRRTAPTASVTTSVTLEDGGMERCGVGPGPNLFSLGWPPAGILVDCRASLTHHPVIGSAPGGSASARAQAPPLLAARRLPPAPPLLAALPLSLQVAQRGRRAGAVLQGHPSRARPRQVVLPSGAQPAAPGLAGGGGQVRTAFDGCSQAQLPDVLHRMARTAKPG